MSRKVKQRKMENLDPRQVQINKVTVIKLGRIDDVDHMNKHSTFHLDRAKGSVPTTTLNITLLSSGVVEGGFGGMASPK
jgi:hypothetical protein